MTLLSTRCFVTNFERLALWSLLFFAFPSCSGPSPGWQEDSAIGTSCSFNSARLYLAPANEFSGLELEFVQMRDGLRLYINVYGLEIPPETYDGSTSRVFISFKDHTYHFSALRFLGGQRLLVPECVQDEMIEYLQEGQSLFIQVGRYQADIDSDKFLVLFQRMAATQL
jgi:hypothetical protein